MKIANQFCFVFFRYVLVCLELFLGAVYVFSSSSSRQVCDALAVWISCGFQHIAAQSSYHNLPLVCLTVRVFVSFQVETWWQIPRNSWSVFSIFFPLRLGVTFKFISIHVSPSWNVRGGMLVIFGRQWIKHRKVWGEWSLRYHASLPGAPAV